MAIETGTLAVRRRLRRRRLRPLQRAPARAVGLGGARRDAATPRRRPWRSPRGRPSPVARGHPGRCRVGLGLHDAARPLPRPSRGHRAMGRRSCGLRQVEGDPFVADPRAVGPRRVRGRGCGRHAPTSRRSWRCSRSTAGRVGQVTPAGRCATTSPISPIGPRRARGPSRSSSRTASGWPTRRRASTPGTSGWSSARAASGPRRRSPASSAAGDALLAAVATIDIEALRSPDGWSWAYDCLHGHVRKHIAMLGPWCATAGWPGERS